MSETPRIAPVDKVPTQNVERVLAVPVITVKGATTCMRDKQHLSHITVCVRQACSRWFSPGKGQEGTYTS